MRITRFIQVASLGAVLALGSTAVYAKEHSHGQASQQTHHCKLADGTTDTSKTHKQCTTAKGTWAKDGATAYATPATTTAPAPAAQTKP